MLPESTRTKELIGDDFKKGLKISGQKKMAIKFSPEITKKIERWARKMKTTERQVLLRILALYDFINQEVIEETAYNETLCIMGEWGDVHHRFKLD
jgi:hypothetical protein